MPKPPLSRNSPFPIALSFWREQRLLPVIAAMLVLSPLVPVSLTSRRWHGAQTLVVEIGAVFLLMTILSRPWSRHPVQDFLRLLRFPPLLFPILLLLWGTISCITAPDKPFAAQGFLQLSLGIFVLFFIATQGQTQSQRLFIVDALLGTAFLVALSGFALYGTDGMTIATGVLHDHMLFGAFLMLLLPICLAACLSPVSLNRRIFAQAVFVACQAALLAAQTRSAWIGESAALVVFGILAWINRPATFTPRSAQREHRNFIRQGILIAAAGLVFASALFWILPDRDAFLARVRTLTSTVAQGKDASTNWRLSAWSGAEKMAQEKPLRGWGIGCYPRYQFPFTQIGRPMAQIKQQGPTILDETHNSYLQIWAELGLVGLLLWLAVLCSFLVVGLVSLKRFPAGSLEQWLLIGCLSAIIGQMVDALANPAWQFGMVALPLWVIFGLTAALARPSAAVEANPYHPPTPIFVRIIQIGAAAGIGFVLLQLILKTAFALPAPHL